MRPGKLVLGLVGALVALAAIGLVVGGGGLLWAQATQRDANGFFTSSTVDLATDSYALTAAEIDLGAQPGDWLPSGRLATIKLDVEARGEGSVFVGIARVSDVDEYLGDVARATVTEIGLDSDQVTYRSFPGEAPPALPSEQTFWVASVEGVGLQTLTWDLQQGEWTLVIMNADATPGIDVEGSAGASTELLAPIAVGLLVGGLVLGAVAAISMVVAVRQTGDIPVAAVAATSAGFGPYPVKLEGRLDRDLSRWQWLAKWLLALPHYIILIFLWMAFAVLTVVAFFAILLTGRYPRGIFEFNVGVMRWTWRVGFYSYSALGTDQYPPFTLAHADYPASFDVAYPETLSRGLVLVKWWLLAIPHYLIVGLFTSGLVWWTAEMRDAGNPVLEVGGGLVGILVLIAGLGLLFAGRYPTGLFELLMGLNRWVYRVWAYVGLMRDEYPPFRIDTGGSEPGVQDPRPPASPSDGDNARVGGSLDRV